MSYYSKTALKSRINSNIIANGVRAITGTVLNIELINTIDSLDLSYTTSITNAGLDANYEIIVTHNLSDDYPLVILYDNNNLRVAENNYDVTSLTANTTKISFTGSITGTYNIRFKKTNQ